MNKKNIIKILKKYLDVGVDYEKNQNDWLRETLKKIPRGSRVLDAGAGEGRNKVFCNHLNYVSQDACQYDGGEINEPMQTGEWDTSAIDIIGDIVDIPESNESFDVILCTEVFEHIPDPIQAIKEFQRLLKEDGILIITAPFCSLTHFAPYHYSTGFNRYFYTYHLDRFGFKVQELTTNGNYFEYIAQEFWRMNHIAKTHSIKSSLMDKLAIFLALRMLKRFSRHDLGSDKILCHGYHVVAKKLHAEIIS